MIDHFYKRLLKPLLFQLDAETAHRLVTTTLGCFPRMCPNRHVNLPRDVAGTVWMGPVGLAAGADKGGHALLLWERLGFGSIEVGTVLPRPQVGNPRPRVHRLPDHKAVVNAMGFPTEGMETVYYRLLGYRERDEWPNIPVGINVSKNKETPDDEAHLDYVAVIKKLRRFADWITVNVSSPNTPGLRDLQKADALKRIIEPVMKAADLPVLVKLSPDMSPRDRANAVRAATEAGVDGFIATNTTLSRPTPSAFTGGMSGAPLFALARENIAAIVESTHRPVIGVGGIDSPAKAAEVLGLGCPAVQLYTGLVYEGPGLVDRINRVVGQYA